jgi:putative transposase
MKKNEYKHTKTTVSLINYHFVFCPRYRRKIFNIPGVEERFKELTIAECKKQGIEILALECHIDHVHMFVSVLPTMSITEIMKRVKGCTSHKLRDEFPQLKAMVSLWTRSYFVSTAGNVSSETIKWYVDTQKTRA